MLHALPQGLLPALLPAPLAPLPSPELLLAGIGTLPPPVAVAAPPSSGEGRAVARVDRLVGAAYAEGGPPHMPTPPPPLPPPRLLPPPPRLPSESTLE